jgi:hypothetical protein
VVAHDLPVGEQPRLLVGQKRYVGDELVEVEPGGVVDDVGIEIGAGGKVDFGAPARRLLRN